MSVEFSQQREKLSTKHTHPAGLVREHQATPGEGEREGGGQVTLAVIQSYRAVSPSELPAPTFTVTGRHRRQQRVEQWLAKLNTLVLFCDEPQP